MNVKVSPGPLNGEVNACGSKSYAHRALIAAAVLSKNPVKIYGITPSNDVTVTENCLRAFGAEIDDGKACVTVVPPEIFPKTVRLNFSESGTSFRLLLPVCAALGITAEFSGSDRLMHRPMEPLFSVLREGGITVEKNRIFGKLKRGTYSIRADVSSQFISGMLFAFALLGSGGLLLSGKSVSAPYVGMTKEVLRDFGVITDGTFVLGREEKKVTEYRVEGDWSNAAFFLVAGAISGNVTVHGLNENSLQGDRGITDILRRFGASVTLGENGITVKNRVITGTMCDISAIPDLFLPLSVLASFSEGVTEFAGVNRLEGKESDRVLGVVSILSEAGIQTVYDKKNDRFFVYGGKPHGGRFQTFSDHRMAMSAAVLAACSTGNSVICKAECVEKSYPAFFRDFEILGGKWHADLER